MKDEIMRKQGRWSTLPSVQEATMAHKQTSANKATEKHTRVQLLHPKSKRWASSSLSPLSRPTLSPLEGGQDSLKYAELKEEVKPGLGRVLGWGLRSGVGGE